MERARRGATSIALAGLLTAVVAASGCGGSEDAPAAQARVVKCKPAERPASFHGHYNPPEQLVGKNEDLVALVNTSCGAFRIALDSKRAQKTVSAFAKLAKNGFYEGQAFDVITPGFMIQTGDPRGNGDNSSGPGFTTLEKPPAGLAYARGTVAMAKRPSDPPGFSRSQFFVVLAPEAKLPPEYALIGRVDKRMDVVDRIGEFGDLSGNPTKRVVIEWIWARKRTPKEKETGVMQLP